MPDRVSLIPDILTSSVWPSTFVTWMISPLTVTACPEISICWPDICTMLPDTLVDTVPDITTYSPDSVNTDTSCPDICTILPDTLIVSVPEKVANTTWPDILTDCPDICTIFPDTLVVTILPLTLVLHLTLWQDLSFSFSSISIFESFDIFTFTEHLSSFL